MEICKYVYHILCNNNIQCCLYCARKECNVVRTITTIYTKIGFQTCSWRLLTLYLDLEAINLLMYFPSPLVQILQIEAISTLLPFMPLIIAMHDFKINKNRQIHQNCGLLLVICRRMRIVATPEWRCIRRPLKQGQSTALYPHLIF